MGERFPPGGRRRLILLALLSLAACLAALASLTGLSRYVAWPVTLAWLVIVPACYAAGLWVSASRRRERLMHASGRRLRQAFGVAVWALVYLRALLGGPAGGAGSVDAAMTGGFVLAGAPLSAALLGAVTFRLFTFWLPALIAVPSIATAPSLRDRLREIAAARG